MPKPKKQPTVRDLESIVREQARQLEQLRETLAQLAEDAPTERSSRKIYRPDVVEILERGPNTARAIADELGVDMWPVFRILQSLRADEGVRLEMIDDEPRWKLIRKADAADLQDWIEDMIRENPLTQGDLETITGASRSRVAGAITQLQRHKGAVGLSEKNWKQGWYIPTDDERDTSPIYEADPPKRSDVIDSDRPTRKRQRKHAVAASDRARANRSRSRRSRRDPSGEDPAKSGAPYLPGETRSVAL